jgi:hypothetical protein
MRSMGESPNPSSIGIPMLATNEKPARSITADAALAGPAGSCTCGAFFPIVDANSALIQALASLSVEHLPTSAIGEADVVSDLPPIRAVRHGQLLFFHKPRFYSFVASAGVPFRTLRESLKWLASIRKAVFLLLALGGESDLFLLMRRSPQPLMILASSPLLTIGTMY